MFPSKLMACIDSPETLADSRKELGWISRRLECPLVIYHALYPFWGELRSHKERKLEEARRIESFRKDPAFCGVDVRILCDSEPRDVVDAILHHASETGTDLLVVPVHEHRGLRRLVQRSISEEITRSCRFPVLTFDMERAPSSESDPAFDHVIAPTDFSPASIMALQPAFSLADRIGCPILVLHSISELVVPAAPTAAALSSLREYRQALEDEAHVRLRSITDGHTKTCASEIRTLIDSGSIVGAVNRAAAASRNPLVVMATAGRDSMGDQVLGSRTERIIRSSRASVLSLPLAFLCALVHEDQLLETP